MQAAYLLWNKPIAVVAKKGYQMWQVARRKLHPKPECNRTTCWQLSSRREKKWQPKHIGPGKTRAVSGLFRHPRVSICSAAAADRLHRTMLPLFFHQGRSRLKAQQCELAESLGVTAAETTAKDRPKNRQGKQDRRVAQVAFLKPSGHYRPRLFFLQDERSGQAIGQNKNQTNSNAKPQAAVWDFEFVWFLCFDVCDLLHDSQDVVF
jgi:hypothetical protein